MAVLIYLERDSGKRCLTFMFSSKHECFVCAVQCDLAVHLIKLLIRFIFTGVIEPNFMIEK